MLSVILWPETINIYTYKEEQRNWLYFLVPAFNIEFSCNTCFKLLFCCKLYNDCVCLSMFQCVMTLQGMCFSLPTPEDPFNDKHEKMDIKGKETKKLVPPKADRRVAINGNSVAPRKGAPVINHQEQIMVKVKNLGNGQTISLTSIDNAGQKNIVKPVKEKIQLIGERSAYAQQRQAFEHSGCPSKFLILCLNSIQNALRHDGFFSTEEDKPLFVDKWGVAFWKFYSVGKDILETGGACSTTEQIAWIASTAADSIARKEKEGLSLTGPFLLFIVPSQEKASKVCIFVLLDSRSVLLTCVDLSPLSFTTSLHWSIIAA